MKPILRAVPKLFFSSLFMFGIFLTSAGSLMAQEKGVEDEALMKPYFFVLLVKGEKRNQDSITVAQIQKAHLENIGRLVEEGKIDIAGPFLDDSDWRGIFIFNVESEDEVKALLEIS